MSRLIVEDREVQAGEQFTHAMTDDDVWTAVEPWGTGGSDGWLFTCPTSGVVATGRLYTNESKHLRRIARKENHESGGVK